MVTWANVRRWDPSHLDKAGGELNKEYQQLVGAAEELRASGTPEGWVGGGADAAGTKNRHLRDDAELWAAELGAVRRATGDLADAMTGVVHGRDEVLVLAERNGFAIADDGSVVDETPPRCLNVSRLEEAKIKAERRRLAKEIEFRVSEVLRQAEDIDHDYCLVLDRVLSGHIIDADSAQHTGIASAGTAGTKLGALSVMTPPPANATAAQNAAYWATLSQRQQDWMARAYPERIGHRNGIAAEDRSIANSVLLDRAQSHLKDRLNALRSENSDNPGPGGASTRAQNQTEIDQIERKLAALDSVEQLTEDADGNPLPDKQLLMLDSTGAEVQAAVSNGNVDTADHVAIFTPGMNADVGQNFSGYVEDMEDLGYQAERQLRMNGDNGSVATVTWLGYSPPSGDEVGSLGGLLTGEAANKGAHDLANFYEGINESRSDDPHMTSLGHSYGSLTQGIALHDQGTGVDDAVFFGSPGISNNANPLDQGTAGLELDEGAAYNMEAGGDAVADVPDVTGRYGQDLASMEGMNQLSTKEATGAGGQPLAASHGHSEYTKIMPDGTLTTSMYNMANVVAGNPENTIIAASP